LKNSVEEIIESIVPSGVRYSETTDERCDGAWIFPGIRQTMPVDPGDTYQDL
jgi:hypothetical protein